MAKRVILGTPFYYRFIRGCFPNEKKIVPKDSRPVPILTEDPESSLANAIDAYERSPTSDSEKSSFDEGQGGSDAQEMLLASTDLASLQVGDDPTVRVARAQWLDPWTQTPVLCTSKSVGLILISAEGGVLTKKDSHRRDRCPQSPARPAILHLGGELHQQETVPTQANENCNSLGSPKGHL